jgi:hypothetical protein
MAKARKNMRKQKSGSTAENGMRKKGAYPYHTLKTAIALGDAVMQGGGDRVGVPKSVVAAAMDMDQGSSAFSMLVASAKTYGIVDGYKELMLTDVGRDYFLPTTAFDTPRAELAFLSQPEVYSFLIEKFDGSTLPTVPMLGNLLSRHFGIASSWSNRVAQNFLSAANDLGVMDQGGRLRYDAAKHKTSVSSCSQDEGAPATIEAPTLKVGANIVPPRINSGPAVNPNSSIWVRGAIRLETPSDMSLADWLRLQKYVEILRPDEEAMEGEQVVASPERGG